jgi:hypothetical protein
MINVNRKKIREIKRSRIRERVTAREEERIKVSERGAIERQIGWRVCTNANDTSSEVEQSVTLFVESC